MPSKRTRYVLAISTLMCVGRFAGELLSSGPCGRLGTAFGLGSPVLRGLFLQSHGWNDAYQSRASESDVAEGCESRSMGGPISLDSLGCHRCESDPYRIIRKVSDLTYKIELRAKSRSHPVISIVRLE